VLGDSTRLPEDVSSPPQSASFDGSQLRLRGARGETLGVQVRLAGPPERRVSLVIPGVAVTIEPFAVRSLEVREPSTDMYGPSTGPGRYPDALLPVIDAVTTSALAFFDVAISPTAVPGSYAGTLAVGDHTVPVELRVSSAKIDLEPDPLVWVFYAPRELARAHGLPDGDDPALIAREAEYYELFRRHGALLATDTSPRRFLARRRFVRNVKLWPVAIDVSSDESITRDVREWLELFRDTGVTPFAIPVDEPKTPAEKARARHIAEVMGAAGAGRPHLLRAVTDRPDPAYGDSIDVFISPAAIPAPPERLARGERFWTYNGRPPQAGSMILDTDGIALRTWGWIAERYGVELWYAWEGMYFSDRYNDRKVTDVMLDPVTFDERTRGGTDFGNGDGLLAYPGARPSLRLKALRRGLQDRLLVKRLVACGGGDEARRIVRSVVPRALAEAGRQPEFAIDEIAWERARGEVLDRVEARCQ
jgi:hypothetical protein